MRYHSYAYNSAASETVHMQLQPSNFVPRSSGSSHNGKAVPVPIMSLTKRVLALRSSFKVQGISSLHEYQHDALQNNKSNHASLPFRLLDVLTRIWHLGFTAFGGPPVHFHILHREFVEGQQARTTWVDEQTYQELFAICQALPGPGSTKMLFCIIFQHAGLLPAVIGFLSWSLPGAIGMFLLAFGVDRISTTLPLPVYALLSGFNASTVGIVALAAVQLASKSITDNLTRMLVIFGACAGMCYTALWYFPVLILAGGFATTIWDVWLSRRIGKLQARRQAAKSRRSAAAAVADEESPVVLPLTVRDSQNTSELRPRSAAADSTSKHAVSTQLPPTSITIEHGENSEHNISAGIGIVVGLVFFASFAAVLVARGLVKPPPLPLDLFANMYLAGTIIFGGGPVVIPLLREYVVQPGWVSSRDFLIGLAIIQAFPGPNFNFAVYLSALAIKSSVSPQYSIALGGFLGYLGIFIPGLTLALAVQGMWKRLRTKPAVISLLRGINSTAVGLVFTAVYRLWEIGYLKPDSTQGQSLASDPWWVVVAALTYSSCAWFKMPAPAAIVGGAILGLLWYAAVGQAILTNGA